MIIYEKLGYTKIQSIMIYNIINENNKYKKSNNK